ncbi:fluoride efflux transporter FluC [Corynebacterium sp. H78]|uniref:fluoride efflux transporter FluC n=1 Tax=Corynebacterium sp. H78 TaxID=3133417 RepID=UPI0030B5EABA
MSSAVFSSIAVGCGAMLGALSRVGLGLALASFAAEPWATVIINLVGCFAFGCARILINQSSTAWLLTGPGFLGGFTTFSAFILLLSQPSLSVIAVAFLGTVLGCPAVLWLGMALAKVIHTRDIEKPVWR